MRTSNTPEQRLKRAEAYLSAYLRVKPTAVNKLVLFTSCVKAAQEEVQTARANEAVAA